MNNSIQKKYPPYTGSEPFIFLCFAKEDAANVEPLLSRLYRRGCRVWYSTEKAKDKKEFDAVSARIAGASLAVVYQTGRSANDTSLKNDIKHAKSKGVNVIIFKGEPIKGNLSLGLPDELPSASDEEQLIRTEGFHAGLIGPVPKKKNIPGIIAAVLLAMVILVGVWAGLKIAKGEPVTLRPEKVTELRLKTLPESAGELEKYPNLKKLIVPQSMAEEALERFDGYTIVLAEG